jgi:hypothetical protein
MRIQIKRNIFDTYKIFKTGHVSYFAKHKTTKLSVFAGPWNVLRLKMYILRLKTYITVLLRILLSFAKILLLQKL